MRPKTKPRSKPASKRFPTIFRFHAPQARTVYVAGDFTGWKVRPMKQADDGSGLWQVSLNLSPGEHQYKFMVDGDWHLDPNQGCTVPNSFGTTNNLVRVGGESTTMALAAS